MNKNRNLLIGILTLALVGGGAAWGQNEQSRASQKNWKRPVRERIKMWQEKLEEYRQGKRNHRDAYIILNKIHHKYGVLRQKESPEARAIQREIEQLREKYPELGDLKDWRLSEEIARTQNAEAEKRALEREAESWRPKDDFITAILQEGERSVAVFRYKLVFLRVPGDVKIQMDTKDRREKFFRDGRVVSPTKLRPRKTITFKYPFMMIPMVKRAPEDTYSNFLVCVQPLDRFVPLTDEERRMLRGKGHPKGLHWKNRKGRYGDFCGIISIDGEIVFKFRYNQQSPGKLMRPLLISNDRRHAAIIIGERVEDPDGEGVYVGKPREVWVWDYPRSVTKHEVKDPKISWWKLKERFEKK